MFRCRAGRGTQVETQVVSLGTPRGHRAARSSQGTRGGEMHHKRTPEICRQSSSTLHMSIDPFTHEKKHRKLGSSCSKPYRERSMEFTLGCSSSNSHNGKPCNLGKELHMDIHVAQTQGTVRPRLSASFVHLTAST